MAFENLISLSFSREELSQMDKAIQALEKVLKGKTVNLTPAQRQQYGRIAEQNKLFVDKAKNYMEQYPDYIPSFLDKSEFDHDYTARTQVEQRLQRLSSITEQLADTKVLLDHDNYHNAITFYRNIKFLANEEMPGTSSVHKDLRQFFVPSAKGNGNPPAPGGNNDGSF